MFEGNILTFNPGWVGVGQPADEYTDIRALRDASVASGIAVADDTTGGTPSGPASFTLTDPDEDAILIDQHIYLPALASLAVAGGNRDRLAFLSLAVFSATSCLAGI